MNDIEASNSANTGSSIRTSGLNDNFDLTTEEKVKSLVNVIRNFLNYVLYHDVCPEYVEQINAAKRLCDQGERELWAVSQNVTKLPGNFNRACSELYGGLYQGQCDPNSSWRLPEDIPSEDMSPSNARQVFKLGMVANASKEQFKKYEAQDKAKSITITKVEEISIEVAETILSNEDVQSLYAIREELKPLGK